MMRYAKMVLSALCLVVSGWLGTAEAFDAFLFIPGVQGESHHTGHLKWIDLYQVSWGHANVGTASIGGIPPGRVQVHFQDVSVQKLLDSASPALAAAVATGQLFPNAVIELLNAGSPAPFARLELTGVSMTAYEANGAAGGQIPRPVESIKLNFSKIAWIYIPQDSMGNAGPPFRGGWDLRRSGAP